jgi:hypothetical protein
VHRLVVVEGPESFAPRVLGLVPGRGGRRVGVARENVETPNIPASGPVPVGAGWGGGALLGPERTTRPPAPLSCCLLWWVGGRGFGCVSRVRSFDLSAAGVVGGLVVRVVVENCTVDASIFCFCSVLLCRDFLMCVLVKLSRAHGGCLGIRSR